MKSFGRRGLLQRGGVPSTYSNKRRDRMLGIPGLASTRVVVAESPGCRSTFSSSSCRVCLGMPGGRDHLKKLTPVLVLPWPQCTTTRSAFTGLLN
eukprot:3940318-Rhodomonas_salina.2